MEGGEERRGTEVFCDDHETKRIVAWVEQYGFERVALQFPDELLGDAAMMVMRLQRSLPDRKFFVLGDSTYGSSTVDEVGAQHYAADCIVHIGPWDQAPIGDTPTLFIFGQAQTAATGGIDSEGLVSALCDHFAPAADVSLALICDVALQVEVEARIGPALARALHGVSSGAKGGDRLFIGVPRREASRSSSSTSAPWRERHDWRFGAAPVTSWVATLGTLALAANSRPRRLRVCGREVRPLCSATSIASGLPGHLLPSCCGLVYVGPADSPLERRLLLRHGATAPLWRIDPSGDDPPVRLKADALLMRRYRNVELVKGAGLIGFLLCTSGAQHVAPLADRLEALLRKAGRSVYRFVMGQSTAGKLGNFPEIECFVSFASPEHFPFDETKEIPVPIASPFEVEVALGVREWTGEYITDIDELLENPPLIPLDTEDSHVQTLGAGARVRHFQAGGSAPGASPTEPVYGSGDRKPPALVTQGQHGVASRYVEEPTLGVRPRAIKDKASS